MRELDKYPAASKVYFDVVDKASCNSPSREKGIAGVRILEQTSVVVLNPKSLDERGKLLLQDVLALYNAELPSMIYAANTGKKSQFLERTITNGRYCTVLLKLPTAGERNSVIAAITYQIIPADTQYVEIPIAAVQRAYQRKGLGSALYKELHRRLQDIGVSTAFCWGDDESEAFWAKQGFVTIAEVDGRGKAKKLPIKAEVRRLMCMPGSASLMICHLGGTTLEKTIGEAGKSSLPFSVVTPVLEAMTPASRFTPSFGSQEKSTCRAATKAGLHNLAPLNIAGAFARVASKPSSEDADVIPSRPASRQAGIGPAHQATEKRSPCMANKDILRDMTNVMSNAATDLQGSYFDVLCEVASSLSHEAENQISDADGVQTNSKKNAQNCKISSPDESFVMSDRSKENCGKSSDDSRFEKADSKGRRVVLKTYARRDHAAVNHTGRDLDAPTVMSEIIPPTAIPSDDSGFEKVDSKRTRVVLRSYSRRDSAAVNHIGRDIVASTVMSEISSGGCKGHSVSSQKLGDSVTQARVKKNGSATDDAEGTQALEGQTKGNDAGQRKTYVSKISTATKRTPSMLPPVPMMEQRCTRQRCSLDSHFDSAILKTLSTDVLVDTKTSMDTSEDVLELAGAACDVEQVCDANQCTLRKNRVNGSAAVADLDLTLKTWPNAYNMELANPSYRREGSQMDSLSFSALNGDHGFRAAESPETLNARISDGMRHLDSPLATGVDSLRKETRIERVDPTCSDVAWGSGKPTASEDCSRKCWADHPSKKKTHIVLFMNMANEERRKQLTKFVEKLGGKVSCKGAECTHVVTGEVRTTLNFCIAIGSGAWVVSPDWLKASVRQGQFVDPASYILNDKAFSMTYGSTLQEVVLRARENPKSLLQGYRIYLPPNVPNIHMLSQVITSAGGKMLSNFKEVKSQDTSHCIMLVSEEYRSEALELAKKGVWVFSIDWFVFCIVRQDLDFTKADLTVSLN